MDDAHSSSKYCLYSGGLYASNDALGLETRTDFVPGDMREAQTVLNILYVPSSHWHLENLSRYFTDEMALLLSVEPSPKIAQVPDLGL